MIYRSLRPAALVRAAVVFTVLLFATDFADAADSILYRLFLQDGTSIISYGEFARVAGRVVLSIPLGDSAQSPTLQLTSTREASVDWQRPIAIRKRCGRNGMARLAARAT